MIINVLIVCSGNAVDFNFEIHQAFIADQVKAIEKTNEQIHFHYFFIKGKGLNGYLINLKYLKQLLKNQPIDVIHAHFSLSGLLANLQRKIPVIVTFHGSDINLTLHRYISGFVQLLSFSTIFVGKKLQRKALFARKSYIVPCGVDFEIFKPISQLESRNAFGLNPNRFYILFSSSFINPVKNYALLKDALELLNDSTIEVIELKGYSRKQVAWLMNAANVCVMTSFNEGSPQFIKEAMACNCPIISTDVGDVNEVLNNTEGNYLCTYDKSDLAKKIMEVKKHNNRTLGRDNIGYLDNEIIAKKIVKVYQDVLQYKLLNKR